MDDDPQVRRLIERILSQAGHHVRSAADGRDGMRLFALRTPDLVITDIVMPHQEGVGTIHALRRAGYTRPIIAISGNGVDAAAEYLHVAGRIGADRTLSKPFHVAELLEVVQSLLASSGPSDSRS
jgi:DNA-binding response OmpR family regulator